MNIRIQWEPYPGEEYTVIAEADGGDVLILGIEDEDHIEYPGMLEVAREDDVLLDRLALEARTEQEWRRASCE